MLDGREQLDRVQHMLLQVLRDIPRKLPDTLQDQFSNLGFLRVRAGPVRRERFDNPQQQSEQPTTEV